MNTQQSTEELPSMSRMVTISITLSPRGIFQTSDYQMEYSWSAKDISIPALEQKCEELKKAIHDLILGSAFNEQTTELANLKIA